MNSPFQQSMVRLQIPDGMGSMISVGGFQLNADAEGCVEVPANLVGELKSHGLREPAPKTSKK